MYNLGSGNPSIDPPKEIFESFSKLTMLAKSDTNTCLFRYTNTAGSQELRAFISKALKTMLGIDNLDKDHIVMTPGSQSALVNLYEAYR